MHFSQHKDAAQLAIYKGITNEHNTCINSERLLHYAAFLGWLWPALKLLPLALASMPADVWHNRNLPPCPGNEKWSYDVIFSHYMQGTCRDYTMLI
jgi:hypothetical protein